MQRDYWSNKPLTVLAQAKSKSPTINKKTNQFLFFFVWSKCGTSFDPPVETKKSLQVLISKFKVRSRTGRQVSNVSTTTVFCFFLPAMSRSVKYWLSRPQTRLSCERLRVRVFRCGRKREIWETARLGATEWIWLCAVTWSLRAPTHTHAHAHPHSLTHTHTLPYPGE